MIRILKKNQVLFLLKKLDITILIFILKKKFKKNSNLNKKLFNNIKSLKI